MAIQKDSTEPSADDEPAPAAPPDVEAEEAAAKQALEKALGRGDEARDLPRDVGETDTPTQLGYKRFVYAAYFGGAIGVAFLGSKIGSLVWYRLSQWKPGWGLGEPKDEIIMSISAALGGALAVYYWRKKTARTYIEEVAQELSNVTWPSRKEVINSTGVVVFTTLFATAFFALMDQFWRFVTDKIYSF
jgi:preprotein translocase subunit SecE